MILSKAMDYLRDKYLWNIKWNSNAQYNGKRRLQSSKTSPNIEQLYSNLINIQINAINHKKLWAKIENTKNRKKRSWRENDMKNLEKHCTNPNK